VEEEENDERGEEEEAATLVFNVVLCEWKEMEIRKEKENLKLEM